MSTQAKTYITAVLAAGLSLLVFQLAGFHSSNLARFLVFFAITASTSGVKVRMPGVEASFSVQFVFTLAAITQLSLPEVLACSVAGSLVQIYWRPKLRPTWIQAAFNVSNGVLAACASYLTCHWTLLDSADVGILGRLTAAAMALFLVNTGGIAIVLALTEHKSLWPVWRQSYFWCLPYYIVCAGLVAGMIYVSRWLGWFAALGTLPVMHLLYRSYRFYWGRMAAEKQYAEQMAALHLRTIEALALAIDAKDHTTHDHLQRVQVYALELGKELGLSSGEMQALQAASLLHDIGKLAVPEHIISKPGKLTPEEFEKMKIHPVVGAEILESVEFPYAVAPIVRAHHEKWDGSGYPDGLKGLDIPIGARILTAVDCLDALASDRQYRRALPLDDAMQMLVNDSGKAFDPRVVEVLARRYREFERMSKNPEMSKTLRSLSIGIKIERGAAPGAGFEDTSVADNGYRGERRLDAAAALASAHQEVQSLYELALAVGDSLHLSDTLSLLATRIQRLAPYDALVVYLLDGEMLRPAFATGEDSRLFSALTIPVGEGLSGWVAENRKPIVNGNPAVEPTYVKNPGTLSRLNSALAIPLADFDSLVGVLTLYHCERNAYSKDHLRVLQVMSSNLTAAVRNALHRPDATPDANTDELTGLPNARDLFLYLDTEIDCSPSSGAGLGIVVCDMDGFRTVNDRYGSIAGDHLLSTVAQHLRESCRTSDYLARAGGDEFVVVMRDLSRAGAEQRMRDFERIVADTAREIFGDAFLALSCGFAIYPEDGDAAEKLLAEAHRRMRAQKQQRRNAHEPSVRNLSFVQ